jgi:hypothetical protein
MNQEVVQARINQLVELEESRRTTFDYMIKNQERIKGKFDQKAH